jgi:hypothetical protein
MQGKQLRKLEAELWRDADQFLIYIKKQHSFFSNIPRY